MYRLVKLVQTTVDNFDKQAKRKHSREGVFVLRPAASMIMQTYSEKYRTPYSATSNICEDAVTYGYLKQGTTHDPGGKDVDGVTELANLYTTTKGRELIDTAFWIIPLGLIEA
jgi:hypothetical protein